MGKDICPLCGGIKIDSTTNFTVDYKFGVVLVRDVPAKVCSQCGEEWTSDETAEKIETIVNLAKNQKQQLLITSYNNYLKAS
ncbi:MAG: type II toxin-antitoxin system MqsA family antitoxin [Melioribacteraceae bacterium]